MNEEKKSRYTEAQAKAAKKYLKESVEDIRIRVPKGNKVKIQEHAAKMGESTNAFVVRAINEAMERDNPITKTSHEDNTPADRTHRKAESGTASRNAFDERREQLLKQYEALTSTAGQEEDKGSSGSQRMKPELNPEEPPRETLDEKLERLYNEHGPNHPRMTPL